MDTMTLLEIVAVLAVLVGVVFLISRLRMRAHHMTLKPVRVPVRRRR